MMAGALNLIVVSLVPNGRNRTCALWTKKYAGPLELPSLCDELLGCHVREVG
jgi:hypothetical protein